MAYMSAEKVKEIRQKIKKEFPEYKFSVTRYHWFGVYVQILEGPADFYEDFQYKENVGSKENFNLQINEHHIDSNFEGVSRDVLSRINRYVSLGTDIKRLTDDLLLILKDILIYQSSRNVDCLEILTEQEAASFFKGLDIDETLKMIDIIMAAQKDYKTVNSIIPLFEVTILKLVATKKDGHQSAPQPKPVEPVYEKPAPAPVSRPAPQPRQEPAPAPKQEEIISLLDQPEPEPEKAPEIVLSKDVLTIKNTKKDGSFFIDDNLMLDIMVISKKDIKNSLIDNWSSIKRIITHPELGRAATMLADGRPLVASQKILVVEYQFPNITEKANLLENQEAIQNVIQTVFNKKMFVYAVSRKDSIRWQQHYMNSYQLGRLPKPDTINIEFEGE